MLVARIRVQLALHDAHSLKDRRSVLKSVKDRLRQRFNVAVAEVGEKQRWSHAELALVTVAETQRGLDATIEALTRFLDGDGRFEMVRREIERD